jgi:hypothetical protein
MIQSGNKADKFGAHLKTCAFKNKMKGSNDRQKKSFDHILSCNSPFDTPDFVQNKSVRRTPSAK